MSVKHGFHTICKMACVVTAYYPVTTRKHSRDEYRKWYRTFFTHVTAPVVCFCPQEMEAEFRSLARENVKLIIRDLYSFKMMSTDMMNKWKEWYMIDPEKDAHSPELYAIWGAKQEFVLEAMKCVENSIFVWCDIGCFRFPRPGGFQNTFRYIVPEKITCLFIANIIGGGVLAGDRIAWERFSKLYLDELEHNIHGKDQDIYIRIMNSDTANIILPTGIYGDEWFYLTYIFCLD